MSGLKFKNGLSVDECTECWGSGGFWIRDIEGDEWGSCDTCGGTGYEGSDYHQYMMEQAEEEVVRKEVKCSYCGTKTRIQPVGDGCHSCSRGIMSHTGN